MDLAQASFEEAIANDPELAAAHTNLGVVYDDQGRLEEAVGALNQAIEIEPGNPLPHLNLGLAHRDLGQVDEAIAAFEAYLDIVPADDPSRGMVEQEIAEMRDAAASGASRRSPGNRRKSGCNYRRRYRRHRERLPAALAEITGREAETDYQGIQVFTMMEERGIILLSISTSGQWDTFEPTFMAILDSLRFFEPEG